jgi:hypothetical protein
MALPKPLPSANVSRLQPPPAHLEKPEADLWRGLTRDYRFDSSASLQLLESALEAKMRSRRCRERIDAEGETWRNSKGDLKPHPLLNAERSARASFIQNMRLLRLDIKI